MASKMGYCTLPPYWLALIQKLFFLRKYILYSCVWVLCLMPFVNFCWLCGDPKYIPSTLLDWSQESRIQNESWCVGINGHVARLADHPKHSRNSSCIPTLKLRDAEPASKPKPSALKTIITGNVESEMWVFTNLTRPRIFWLVQLRAYS